MSKIVSCGIAPIRKKGSEIEILLCVPKGMGSARSSFYGTGFLKGQVEEDETNLEAARREFCEESGDLEVELYDEGMYFTQNNPKKKIHIWPAKMKPTQVNSDKVSRDGIVHYHDEENELIKFYSIRNLPPVFKNQQKILGELLEFIEENKETLL